MRPPSPAIRPSAPTRTIKQIIDDIWQNRDRDYNVRCLVRRLQRIDKEMSGEARELFARFIPDGDVSRFAQAIPRRLNDDFAGVMQLLLRTQLLRIVKKAGLTAWPKLFQNLRASRA